MPASLLPVRPAWTLHLTHAATALAATPDATRVAFASDTPLISVASLGESSTRSVRLSEPARDLAIKPDGSALAVVGASRSIRVLALDVVAFGRELAKWDAPACDACAFSRDGRSLWTASVLPDESAEVRCYDAGTGAAIGQHRFKPPAAGCGFALTVHPQQDLLGLWACAGPGEMWNYWIRLTAAGVELQHQPELDGWTPPCFNARGDRFVALNQYDLAVFAFPSCASLYRPMTSADGDEDDVWIGSVDYLDSTTGDRVLASTNDGRLFVVAFERGEIVAELAIEGHEPRPCYQVYTSLSRALDARPCTDLHASAAAGHNLVLSVHTNGKTTNRKDTILLWRAPS